MERSKPGYIGGLTRRQLQALHYIAESIARHGFPPTVHELCHALGCRSTNAVHQLLKALEQKGYIRRCGRGQARTLQLTEKALGGLGGPYQVAQGRSIPLLRSGIVLDPEQALRLPHGHLFVDPALFPEEELFALVVPDDGLSGIGISAGDIVLVHRSHALQVGQVAVVWINSAIVVRSLHQTVHGWELRAAARHFVPIRFQPPDPELKVLGYVVGLIRRYTFPQPGEESP